jgi:hypothetical protein
MNLVSAEDQEILDSLQSAVAEALDRKRRLGQYAVIWRNGQIVILGEESPTRPRRFAQPDITKKETTAGDSVEPIL